MRTWFEVLPSLILTLTPSAIVIGAQKAGTTALYEYLALHPRVAPSKVKEINFFNCNCRYARGKDFYHSHFPSRRPDNEGKLTFDVTPGYLGEAATAAPRIHDYNPDIKLIVLLRDPVFRAYSAWQMYRRNYRASRDWFTNWVSYCDESLSQSAFQKRSRSFGLDFADDVRDELGAMAEGRIIEMPILLLGMYHELLSHYFRLFRRDQLLVLFSEEMQSATIEHLHQVEVFVGLEAHAWRSDQTTPRFVGGYNDAMDEGARALLVSFYQREKSALKDLLCKRLPWA